MGDPLQPEGWTRVPGRCWVYLDEKLRTGQMTATVVKRLGRNRKGPTERVEDKLSTVGTQTGSEAENSGRAGEYTRSPTVIKLNSVEPDGTRGKNQH